MRVLVTGGSGLVGQSIIRNLAVDHTVVGLSRRPAPGAHQSIQHDLSVPGIGAVTAITAPCEAIVHAAARIDTDPFNPSVVLTNVIGAQNIAALAAEWSAYVIYLSSIQVIGVPRELPVTEDHPAAPRTTYHATKLFGEHVLAGHGRAACALRLTAPVGADMPGNRILPVFAARAAAGEPLMLTGTGARRQDYVHVDDIAAGVAACIVRRPSGIYNIGAGASISNLELARLCVETLGSRSEIAFTGTADPEEDARWDVSIAKARETFGYTPKGDLRDVIRSLAAKG